MNLIELIIVACGFLVGWMFGMVVVLALMIHDPIQFYNVLLKDKLKEAKRKDDPMPCDCKPDGIGCVKCW